MDSNSIISENTRIERAFDWFLSFLPAGDWDARKRSIEDQIESFFQTRPDASIGDFNSLTGTSDKIAWYLYLVWAWLYEPLSTEVNQAARVVPVFQRIGTDLDKLMKIKGVESQMLKVLGPSKGQPDSVLFEMLVGLLWARNGWSDVEFLPASKSEKRPDILAKDGNSDWFIEAKRMTTNSVYSRRERDKWLRMWTPLSRLLVRKRYPFILDIAFHVELESLPDDFVIRNLESKLMLIAFPCHLISNDIWDVHVRFVDFDKINSHLSDYSVKSPSRQLQELVGGDWDRKKGFTMVMSCSTSRVRGGIGMDHYVDEIEWAAGAYWACDSERATEAKARDIRGHLSDAVEQLPASGASAIHVGIETLDGEHVEAERFKRIINTVSFFDPRGKNLRWVYVHLYEPYAPPPPSPPWLFDETLYISGANRADNPEPISNRFTVIRPDERDEDHGVHWMRPAP